ncbi:MAG: hypothetical protein ACLSFZ_00600 [Frisingicoccus sp.]
MVDYKLVANIFGDFTGLYTGKKPVGVRELCQKYEGNTLFLAMIGNLDEAVKVPAPVFLRDIYEILKPYRSRLLEDKEWEAVVNATGELNQKYKNNVWCRQIILEFLELLEKDDKELRELEEKTEEAA